MRGLDRLARRKQAEDLYDEYLRRIDVEAVLDHYAPENLFRRGDELIHSCLIERVDPHHAHGDRSPSASMNITSKKYNCFGYGGGDVFWFMMKMEEEVEFADIVGRLAPFLTGQTVDSTEILDELERIITSDEVTVRMPVYHERVLARWALYHPYLRSRGIDKQTAGALQLGYDERHVRITIPHWHEGRLVGWQGRALTDPRWPMTPPEQDGPTPKYKSSTGFPKATTLYNLDRVRVRELREVIVVESPFSVIRAEALGLPNVLATFGAKVGQAQIELLKDFDIVTVYTDSDVAGRRAALRLLTGLYSFTHAFHVEPETAMDLGDYSDLSDLTRILDRAEPAALVIDRLEEHYGRRPTRR